MQELRHINKLVNIESDHISKRLERLPSESREVILGARKTEIVPVDILIMLAQSRDSTNSALPDLESSIEGSTGLLNQIDVAKLSEEHFIEYLIFVNKTWGTELQLSDYSELSVEGTYYLVVAGHSRTQAVKNIAKRNPNDLYKMEVKIHDIHTPEDIIQIQLDENIHTNVKEEREAMAIVEAYMWGLERGHFTTKEEFIRQQNGKIKRGKLKRALSFAGLPHEFREFVLAGHVPFSVSLELGDAMDDLREFEMMKLGFSQEDLAEDGVSDVLAKATALRATEVILHIARTKSLKHVTRAKKHIQGLRKGWRDEIGKNTAEDNLFSFVSAAAQDREYLDARTKEVVTSIRDVAGITRDQAESLISLAGRLAGIETAEARRELEEANRLALRIIGESTINTVNRTAN